MLSLLSLCLAVGVVPARFAPAASGVNAALSEPRPLTVVEVGRTRVIAVEVPEEPAPAAEFPVSPPPGGEVEVIGPARYSATAHRAFVRVRGIHPGQAALTVGGVAAQIEVVAARTQPPAPTIFAPASGAAVWGKFTVGVEINDDQRARSVSLRVSTGADPAASATPVRELQPIEISKHGWGPMRTAVFEIEAPTTGERLTLEPVRVDEAGVEHRGAAVEVAVLHPAGSAVEHFEAEAAYEVTRPKRFMSATRSIGSDRAASGGKFLYNYSSEPALCVPLKVEKAGWYQVMGVFGGDSAAGALPTVSLVVDGANYGSTNARLAMAGWHRIALGVPINLAAGEHVLTPYFENDFYVPGKTDRNLKTDYIEVVRIADADGPGGSGGATMNAGPPMSGMMTKGATSGAMTGSLTGSMMAKSPPGAPGPMVGAMAADALPISEDSQDAWGMQSRPLRVAFEMPIDGQSAPGDWIISGRCWWEGLDQAPLPAPVVSLVINGRTVASQRSAAPRFELDASLWHPGENTVQFAAAFEGGAAATTPVQHVTWNGPPVMSADPHWLRYTVHDPAWSEAAAKKAHHAECDERAFFDLSSNGRLELTLPDDVEGRFQILLGSRGDEFDGLPEAVLTLATDGAEREIAKIGIPHWWGEHEIAATDLPKGPKRLFVDFKNDKYEPGKGDRNLFVESLVLRRIRTEADTTPPTIRVVYPRADQPWRGFMADAIVIEACDDTAVHEAELVIDGVQTGQSRWMDRQAGTVIIPILAREMDPGKHTIAVRVRDPAGNTMTSEERTFERLAAAAPERTTYERAVHLADRFAFGPDERELIAILTMGEDAWLRKSLWQATDDPSDLAALGRGLIFYRNPRSDYEVKGRALQQAMSTTNPVRARFVFWAENHFSTWVSKVEGERKWHEHVAFSRLGPAPFSDLLLTSATGPAMIHYLDQEQSYAGRINENYAREIMELHTLGVHGGYTQADVTALANLLTGWTAAQEGDGRSGGEIRNFQFHFDPVLSEGGPITLLGVAYPEASRAQRYARVRAVLELLAAHPSTARFICGKLAAHYTSCPPDPALVADLAKVFEATGGDLREVLMAIARHPSFWSDRQQRLAHPLDYSLRLVRVCGANNPWLVIEFLQRSGAGLFDRATPDGYPEDDAHYADSNALAQRWNMAHELRWPLSNLCLPRLRWGDAAKDPRWAQNVIDSFAIRLTGDVLGEESNAAMLKAADETTGSPHDRARAIGETLARMPELNLR